MRKLKNRTGTIMIGDNSGRLGLVIARLLYNGGDNMCVCMCVCTVSYTHLDVYKRQVFISKKKFLILLL